MTEARKRVRIQAETRREQILSEATRLIGERGYYGFGIRELADRCQISNPGLLHHFPSKEALLIALLEDRDRTGKETLQAKLRLPRPIEMDALTLEHVHAVFHTTAAWNSARPEFVRLFTVLQAEALNSAHPAHDYFVARQGVVIAAYAQLVAPFVANARSTALHLVVTLDGLQQEWLRADQAFDLVAETDLAVGRILPPSPSRT